MDVQAAGKKAKKIAMRTAIAGAIFTLVGPVLYTEATIHYSYSNGERVGYVQKVSKKGWVCKTNEGELAMVNLAGQQAQMFDFTVPDDSVVGQMEALAGHRVALAYEEHRGIPSSCFGETQYFVTGVKRAD